jgi:dimethylaniline monooxygenase (N-oxide forming)
VASSLEVGDTSLTLFERTFHPDASDLAFMGLWSQIGPYLPPLKMQAHYLAYTCGGIIEAPDRTTLEAGLDNSRAERGCDIHQHVQTIRFARLAGVDPEGRIDGDLADLMARTAVAGLTFRLVGHDASPDAEAGIRAEARRFGQKNLNPA